MLVTSRGIGHRRNNTEKHRARQLVAGRTAGRGSLVFLKAAPYDGSGDRFELTAMETDGGLSRLA